jgi:tetratricopeptide (TPR) repeat protein
MLVNELYDAGDYSALVGAQKPEASIKTGFGVNHVNYAMAIEYLGRVHHAQGRYAEAEAYYKRALAISEAKLGKARAGDPGGKAWREHPPLRRRSTT